MVRGKTTRRWVLAGAICAGAAAAALGQAGLQLLVNGRAASHDVLVINGRAYVPLDDMAAALGLSVRQSATGYEVTGPATRPTAPPVEGGISPVAPAPEPHASETTPPPVWATPPNVTGTTRPTLPQDASTSRWSFRVRSIGFPETYRETLHRPHRTLRPRNADEKLVVLACRVNNRLRSSQTPLLAMRTAGNTVLITEDGSSFRPIAYDSRQESEQVANSAEGRLTPGAYQDFALVFSIPKGEQPRELLFTLGNDPVEGQSTDVRVGLP